MAMMSTRSASSPTGSPSGSAKRKAGSSLGGDAKRLKHQRSRSPDKPTVSQGSSHRILRDYTEEKGLSMLVRKMRRDVRKAATNRVSQLDKFVDWMVRIWYYERQHSTTDSKGNPVPSKIRGMPVPTLQAAIGYTNWALLRSRYMGRSSTWNNHGTRHLFAFSPATPTHGMDEQSLHVRVRPQVDAALGVEHINSWMRLAPNCFRTYDVRGYDLPVPTASSNRSASPVTAAAHAPRAITIESMPIRPAMAAPMIAQSLMYPYAQQQAPQQPSTGVPQPIPVMFQMPMASALSVPAMVASTAPSTPSHATPMYYHQPHPHLASMVVPPPLGMGLYIPTPVRFSSMGTVASPMVWPTNPQQAYGSKPNDPKVIHK